MLYGFDEQTSPLTEVEEHVLLPLIVQGLKNRTNADGDIDKDGPVTEIYACRKLNALGHNITGPRWRKIINYIRVRGIVPRLCASSKGYWVETDDERYMKWIGSIQGRIDALVAVRDSAIKELPLEKQNTWQSYHS